MFPECVIRGVTLRPARFCAPLAGCTHSAFRRLAAEFGGCGAFWTEMLAARQILNEDFARSPYLKRRPIEGRVFYQLMVREDDPLEGILARLAEHGVDALDINLACHAPVIRSRAAGSRLFADAPALAAVLREARRCWPGILTAKIRLGHEVPDWEKRLAERLRIIEEAGVDAVILHPRFFEDKFKRRARHEWLAWAAAHTRLPLIANGDLAGPEEAGRLAERLRPAQGLMIGRMAIARPWIFAAWARACGAPDAAAAPLPATPADYAAVWNRLAGYIEEDFDPAAALVRLKIFVKYFAVNFRFGHGFGAAIHNAATLAEARARADDFFAREPALLREPSLMGI